MNGDLTSMFYIVKRFRRLANYSEIFHTYARVVRKRLWRAVVVRCFYFKSVFAQMMMNVVDREFTPGKNLSRATSVDGLSVSREI